MVMMLSIFVIRKQQISGGTWLRTWEEKVK